MIKEKMSKEKTLSKLREESEILCSGFKLVIVLFSVNLAAAIIALLAVIFFHGPIASILAGEGQGALPSLVRLAADISSDHSLLNAQGGINLPLCLFGLLSSVLNSAIPAYIFYAIYRIFRTIKRGQTPFTLENALYWKHCYQIFTVLAVINFLGAFIIHPFMISAVTCVIIGSFFYALCLIFEYGNQLQRESDETL